MEPEVTQRRLSKRFGEDKSENEYLEFTTVVQVPDDGYRKVNPPFITMTSEGVSEDYPKNPTVKRMVNLQLRRYVIPGYYKPEDLELKPEEDALEKFFGKSYDSLAKYVKEFNYNNVVDEAYKLNFYEI